MEHPSKRCFFEQGWAAELSPRDSVRTIPRLAPFKMLVHHGVSHSRYQQARDITRIPPRQRRQESVLPLVAVEIFQNEATRPRDKADNQHERYSRAHVGSPRAKIDEAVKLQKGGEIIEQ